MRAEDNRAVHTHGVVIPVFGALVVTFASALCLGRYAKK
jgi:hypothetical protein